MRTFFFLGFLMLSIISNGISLRVPEKMSKDNLKATTPESNITKLDRDDVQVVGRVQQLEVELDSSLLDLQNRGKLGLTLAVKLSSGAASTGKENTGLSSSVILEGRDDTLTEALNLSSAKRVALNLLDHHFSSLNRLRFTCDSGLSGAAAFSALPSCPDFQPCAAKLTSKTGSENDHLSLGSQLLPEGSILACSAGISDNDWNVFPLPALNCKRWHSLSEKDKDKVLRPLTLSDGRKDLAAHRLFLKNPESGCAHKTDFIPESPVAFSVYQLRNVHVSGEGLIFDKSTLFLRLGCQDGVHRNLPMEFDPGSLTLKRVGVVVNWVYRQGSNFYHSLIESFPLFLSLAPIMNRNRNIPILGLFYQFEVYNSLLAPLVGVPLKKLKRYEMKRGEIYRADIMYQPVYQICGHPSKSLWTELRARHLLHPQGVPLFNPDWSIRPTRAMNPKETAQYPPDWVVVVAQRPGTKRALLEIKEIIDAVSAMFPPERVVVFRGLRSILEARDLFRRARIFIASHGAALANMIFMPTESSVVEIRPDGYPNSCFHSLADACSLRYNLIFAEGTSSSTVSVNVSSVMDVMKQIGLKL